MKNGLLRQPRLVWLTFALFIGICMTAGAGIGQAQSIQTKLTAAPPGQQTPPADVVADQCSNCHKDFGDTFVHSTHIGSGVECSKCHTASDATTADPAMGLGPVGHPFSPTQESCTGCHQDTAHTLENLVLLSGQGAAVTQVATATLSQASGEQATPEANPKPQTPGVYAGPEVCGNCHKDLYDTWSTTRHAQAFSSPIFQQDWAKVGSNFTCLECHTTGFNSVNSSYSHEGVTCESCHGPFQPGHAQTENKTLMPITPDAELCRTCHQSTTDEWKASPHSAADIQCQSCHDPHSQTPRADNVTELCTNCHKSMEDSFAHSTHAESGVECSNCHMYTAPRSEDAVMGLVPTGHTFTVGSEACIGCHQDTVHTRDTIVKLSGQGAAPEVDTATLEQQIVEQSTTIQGLEAQSSVRLYTGLAQGAIVGLVTGGVAAWIISRRIKVTEEEEEE